MVTFSVYELETILEALNVAASAKKTETKFTDLARIIERDYIRLRLHSGLGTSK